GDLNNDQKLDLLIYDYNNPGIIPFLSIGALRFRQGTVVDPDNAVSKLALVHLNNDNLLDFVFYDWVRSELHLVYGVGQGKFLDQAAFPVEGEVNHFFAEQTTPTGTLDFILSYEKPSLLEVWEGNGLGDFRPRLRIPLKETITSIAIGDVNRDGYKDIVALEQPSQMQVFLSAGMESTPEHLDFSAGGDARQVLLHDVDGDALPDALLLDRERQQLLIYFNAQASVALKDSLEFITGLGPRAIWTDDTNGDGIKEIALVNTRSSSLSLFSNWGLRGIQGQATYPLAAGPRHMAFHSLWDSTARFIISYPQSDQLSFFTIDLRERSSTNAIIPVAGETEILAWEGMNRNLVDFYCFNWASSSGTPSLTSFQQIGAQTFIEKSFRLSIPNTLLGAAVGDLNSDAMQDVAYIYHNNSTSKYEFAISLGDTASSFKQKTFSYELPEKVIEKSYLWIADVTRDSIPDVVFSFPKNEQVMKLARGKGDGSFARPDTIALNIGIDDREQLQFDDFDGDGVLDIVVNDAISRSVGWLRGETGGTFGEFHPLVSEAHIGHFAVGDLNGDGVPDLAITLPDKGTMKIYDGRLLRERQREILR
ncbi:MAG: VCBS repeat-containing protein, partial [Bacteroidota bacterium]